MNAIEIDERICTGCQECVKSCPAYAISGDAQKPQKIEEKRCINCGRCVQTCKSYLSPDEKNTALYERIKKERHIPAFVREPLFAAHNACRLDALRSALADPAKRTMVQCAPAVRVAIGEDFGWDFGGNAAGKLAAALRRLGFDKVYDTNFSADLTIMEEGTELVKRVTQGGVLPMFTSCCPAWVRFLENTYPALAKHLSSCKSPQQMLGAVFKTYGSKLEGWDAADVMSVSVMPCTCKAYEAARPEMNASGGRDVDIVVTTRELAWLIKENGIDFSALPEEPFDEPLGEYSGAGNLFGITGGVMEAAIRTGYVLVTGKELTDVEVTAVRGREGFRRADIKVGDITLKIGVVTGLTGIVELLTSVAKGTCDLHFIEVMTCPEGCVSGGGQPKLLTDADKDDAYAARRQATIAYDRALPLRKSHENPGIKRLYSEYLGEPGGEKPHHLLHTQYCIKG